MITVMLYGFLGKKFGKVHKYSISTPAEAVRALCATLPGFKQSLIDGGKYRVLKAGKEPMAVENLQDPQSSKETIRIIPVVEGSKNGVGQIILGIALVVAAYFTGGTSLAFMQPMLAGMGASLILGGISQLLYKPTKAENVDKAENKASSSFDGAVNTIAQGNAVPICYGKLLVGSQVISAGLSVEQL